MTCDNCDWWKYPGYSAKFNNKRERLAYEWEGYCSNPNVPISFATWIPRVCEFFRPEILFRNFEL